MSEKIKDGGPALSWELLPEKTVSKFFSSVLIRGDGCWEWLGARTQKGYGIMSLSKKDQVRAHRFALGMNLKRHPSGYVLHRCDNPWCVNPEHLEEGTHGDNMRQMAERKRAAREERHHRAKLRFEVVVAMVLLNRSGDYSTRELANMFGVSQPTAAAICCGDLWPDAYALADAMIRAREKDGT